MSRRLLPLALKALCVGLVWAGMAERDVAVLVTVLVAAWAVHTVRAGIREQYREPAHEQHARQWEALVWGASRWLNGAETPEEGIARLATPHLTGGKR